ncbi:MAG TPA: PepSY-like domain-containing protein [Puia sp.]|jgi:hypothetical protein|nr:PepSY-like domain-containing protein [Puia sp.]
MKKPIFFILALAFAGFANAQKLDAAKVPGPVKESFAKQFPGITGAKWELEDGNYEAGFKKGDKSMAATFKPDGTFTESEVTIKVSALPASVSNYLKEHYKGEPVKEAAKITKANGEINYEAEVKKMDVLFDANGKFIKEAKD